MPQNFKNNDFRLGMFGFLFRTTVKWDVWGIDPNPPHKPYLAFNGTMVKVKGIKYPSSQLNVLRSHGFNTVQRYFPGTYFTSEHFLGSLLSLVKLNPDSAVEKKFLFLGYKSNCVAVEKNLV